MSGNRVTSLPPLSDIVRSHKNGVFHRDEKLGVNVLGKGIREKAWLYNVIESFYEDESRGTLFSCLNLYFVNDYGDTDVVQYPFLPYFLLRVNCDEGDISISNIERNMIEEDTYKNVTSNVPAHVQTLISTLMQKFQTEIFCINVIYKDPLGDVAALSKEPNMYLKVSFLLQKEMKEAAKTLITILGGEDNCKIKTAKRGLSLNTEEHLRRQRSVGSTTNENLKKDTTIMKDNQKPGYQMSTNCFGNDENLITDNERILETFESMKVGTGIQDGQLNGSSKFNNSEDILLNSIICIREWDVAYETRAMIDTGIRCSQWYEIRILKDSEAQTAIECIAGESPIYQEYRISEDLRNRSIIYRPLVVDSVLNSAHSDIRFATPILVYQPIEDRPELRILAYDIETTKQPLRFPNAAEGDEVMMISYMVNEQGFLIVNREVVSSDIEDFEYTPAERMKGRFKVFNEHNEKDLLIRFFEHIRDVRPQLFVTFNGDFFDFGFIRDRATLNGLDMEDEIGVFATTGTLLLNSGDDKAGVKSDLEFKTKYGFSAQRRAPKIQSKDVSTSLSSKKKDSSSANQPYYSSRYAPHMDVFKWVKRDSYLPQGSQGLKAVTRAKMRYDPLELDPEDMTPFAAQKPFLLASYSVSDAVATYYLYMKYVHLFIFSLCTIIPMKPDDVLRKGSGTLCEALLMTNAYKCNIVFPPKKNNNAISLFRGHIVDTQTYVGAKVEALRSGVFRSDLTYDFALEPQAYQALIDRLDRDLEHFIKFDCRTDPTRVINLQSERSNILSQLTYLRDNPNISSRPLIYHLDVAAMYPNIILTNRLQPTSMVSQADCAHCDMAPRDTRRVTVRDIEDGGTGAQKGKQEDEQKRGPKRAKQLDIEGDISLARALDTFEFNKSNNDPNNTCQRKMEWVWRGVYFTSNDIGLAIEQLSSALYSSDGTVIVGGVKEDGNKSKITAATPNKPPTAKKPAQFISTGFSRQEEMNVTKEEQIMEKERRIRQRDKVLQQRMAEEQGEDEDKPLTFSELPELLKIKMLRAKIEQLSKKIHRCIRKTNSEIRTSVVCQRSNSFYIETVRSFRDRRYTFKDLQKEWSIKTAQEKAEYESMMDEYKKLQQQEGGSHHTSDNNNNNNKGNTLDRDKPQQPTRHIDAISLITQRNKFNACEAMVTLSESQQLAHKCILNSFYGYVMRPGARWYSMEMAGVVTNTGAKIIRDARRLIAGLGMPLELDTDGIWGAFPKEFPDRFRLRILKDGIPFGSEASKNESSYRIMTMTYPEILLNSQTHMKYLNPQNQELITPNVSTHKPRQTDQTNLLLAKGSDRNISVPITTALELVKTGQHLEQKPRIIHELTDTFDSTRYSSGVVPTTIQPHTFILRSECSIRFEVDGPYHSMFLPAALQEGKKLKKRYAIHNFDGSLQELKGFEMKRRGELQIIKDFQSKVFDEFLSGNSLETVYLSVAAVAQRYLDVVDTQGKFLPDAELVRLISESVNMRKSVNEYPVGTKAAAITTARRLAQLMMVEEKERQTASGQRNVGRGNNDKDFTSSNNILDSKGLACRYVVARCQSNDGTSKFIPTATKQKGSSQKKDSDGGNTNKGSTNTNTNVSTSAASSSDDKDSGVSARCIPVEVFNHKSVSATTRVKLLRGWTNNRTLGITSGDIDIRDILDWGYYRERLEKCIQKIIVIPAALQGLRRSPMAMVWTNREKEGGNVCSGGKDKSAVCLSTTKDKLIIFPDWIQQKRDRQRSQATISRFLRDAVVPSAAPVQRNNTNPIGRTETTAKVTGGLDNRTNKVNRKDIEEVSDEDQDGTNNISKTNQVDTTNSVPLMCPKRGEDVVGWWKYFSHKWEEEENMKGTGRGRNVTPNQFGNFAGGNVSKMKNKKESDGTTLQVLQAMPISDSCCKLIVVLHYKSETGSKTTSGTIMLYDKDTYIYNYMTVPESIKVKVTAGNNDKSKEYSVPTKHLTLPTYQKPQHLVIRKVSPNSLVSFQPLLHNTVISIYKYPPLLHRLYSSGTSLQLRSGSTRSLSAAQPKVKTTITAFYNPTNSTTGQNSLHSKLITAFQNGVSVALTNEELKRGSVTSAGGQEASSILLGNNHLDGSLLEEVGDGMCISARRVFCLPSGTIVDGTDGPKNTIRTNPVNYYPPGSLYGINKAQGKSAGQDDMHSIQNTQGMQDILVSVIGAVENGVLTELCVSIIHIGHAASKQTSRQNKNNTKTTDETPRGNSGEKLAMSIERYVRRYWNITGVKANVVREYVEGWNGACLSVRDWVSKICKPKEDEKCLMWICGGDRKSGTNGLGLVGEMLEGHNAVPSTAPTKTSPTSSSPFILLPPPAYQSRVISDSFQSSSNSNVLHHLSTTLNECISGALHLRPSVLLSSVFGIPWSLAPSLPDLPHSASIISASSLPLALDILLQRAAKEMDLILPLKATGIKGGNNKDSGNIRTPGLWPQAMGGVLAENRSLTRAVVTEFSLSGLMLLGILASEHGNSGTTPTGIVHPVLLALQTVVKSLVAAALGDFGESDILECLESQDPGDVRTLRSFPLKLLDFLPTYLFGSSTYSVYDLSFPAGLVCENVNRITRTITDTVVRILGSGSSMINCVGGSGGQNSGQTNTPIIRLTNVSMYVNTYKYSQRHAMNVSKHLQAELGRELGREYGNTVVVKKTSFRVMNVSIKQLHDAVLYISPSNYIIVNSNTKETDGDNNQNHSTPSSSPQYSLTLSLPLLSPLPRSLRNHLTTIFKLFLLYPLQQVQLLSGTQSSSGKRLALEHFATMFVGGVLRKYVRNMAGEVLGMTEWDVGEMDETMDNDGAIDNVDDNDTGASTGDIDDYEGDVDGLSEVACLRMLEREKIALGQRRAKWLKGVFGLSTSEGNLKDNKNTGGSHESDLFDTGHDISSDESVEEVNEEDTSSDIPSATSTTRLTLLTERLNQIRLNRITVGELTSSSSSPSSASTLTPPLLFTTLLHSILSLDKSSTTVQDVEGLKMLLKGEPVTAGLATVANEAYEIRSILMKIMEVSEYRNETGGLSKGNELGVIGSLCYNLVCPLCAYTRQIDLLYDVDVIRDENLVCTSCGGIINSRHIEEFLISSANALLSQFLIGDSYCPQCSSLRTTNMSFKCLVCHGDLVLRDSRSEVANNLKILRNIACLHKFTRLLEAVDAIYRAI